MSELRRIAIHVVEPKTNQFKWVLSELDHDGKSVNQLQQAQHPEDTYHAAMAAGLLALQALVEDLDTGPRTLQSDASATPDNDGPTAPDDKKRADVPAQAARKAGGFFGFGPVR